MKLKQPALLSKPVEGELMPAISLINNKTALVKDSGYNEIDIKMPNYSKTARCLYRRKDKYMGEGLLFLGE